MHPYNIMNTLPSIQIILNNVQDKKCKYYSILNSSIKDKIDNYRIILTIVNSDGLINIINNKKLTTQVYDSMLDIRFKNENPINISAELFKENDIIYI